MGFRNHTHLAWAVLWFLVLTANSWADTKSGYERDPGFGSPDSVPSQLEEDDKIKEPTFVFPGMDESLRSWFEWKKGINSKHGLRLGTDYSTLYQRANDVLSGQNYAASGALRFFGSWTLAGRDTKNSGSLVFKVENRHRLGSDVAPAGFAGNLGYLGVTGTLFSDVGSVLVDFNWQQRLAEGRGGFLIGRYDPNDYIDVMGYANPWTTFSNVAILINTSMAIPDASWGIGGGSWINDQWYLLASANDANGTITDTSFFKGGSELFTAVEVGWSPSRAERYTNNINVTYWHVDERTAVAIPESDGVGVSGNWTINKKWMFFSRLGWSNGLAPMMQKTATAGFMLRPNVRSDLMGLGVNWGDPSDNALREQITTEYFYRWQMAQNLAFTPSVQWLVNPALNPGADSIWILGIRARLTL